MYGMFSGVWLKLKSPSWFSLHSFSSICSVAWVFQGYQRYGLGSVGRDLHVDHQRIFWEFSEIQKNAILVIFLSIFHISIFCGSGSSIKISLVSSFFFVFLQGLVFINRFTVRFVLIYIGFSSLTSICHPIRGQILYSLTNLLVGISVHTSPSL